MRPIIFVDLDDTLFATLRKNPGASISAALDRSGQSRSFMSSRQKAFLEWLSRDAELIPTTGRNRAALERVLIRFEGHAICSFGGLILTPQGQPDPRWHSHIRAAAAQHLDTLREVECLVRSTAADLEVEVRVQQVSDAEIPLYVTAKHVQADPRALARLAQRGAAFVPPGWRLHRNDNNLAVIPPFLGKERAVAWFLEHIAEPGTFAIGVGDSLSDFEFMRLCDYALTPSRSQLFEAMAEPVAR